MEWDGNGNIVASIAEYRAFFCCGGARVQQSDISCRANTRLLRRRSSGRSEMPFTMHVPRRDEGGLAAAPAPAPAPAPPPDSGASEGARASGKTHTKQDEQETLGQLRYRLGPGLARVPGPRAAFVHIKVEDSTSGEDTDGEGGGMEGEQATGVEGDEEEEEEGESEDEDEGEVEEDEDEEDEEEEGQQREQHAQAPDASFDGRMAASADAVAPPGARGCHPGATRILLSSWMLMQNK